MNAVIKDLRGLAAKDFKQFEGLAIWNLQAELSWNPDGRRWLHHGASFNSYTVIGIGWKLYLRIVLSCSSRLTREQRYVRERVKF